MVFFPRTFGVIRFLNTKHGPVLRTAFACIGFISTLLSTGRLSLAVQTLQEFWDGSFKLAGRRVGWYLRTSWMRWHIAHDPFFNFTDGLSHDLVVQQDAFLKRSKGRLSDETYYGNAMLIAAHFAHDALLQGDQTAYQTARSTYFDCAEVVLNVPSDDGIMPKTRPMEEKSYDSFRTLAAEALAGFDGVLKQISFEWFVLGGTLLGAVREGDFLAHDHDIDLGMFLEPEQIETLVHLFADTADFTTVKLDERSEVLRQNNVDRTLRKSVTFLKLVHKNGVNIDIFFHEEVDGKYVHGSGALLWENTPFQLDTYMLGGRPVLGPRDANLYLTEHYGNWTQEQKDFSCVTDTTNIAYVQNFFTIAFHIKRLALLSKIDTARAVQISKTMLSQKIIVDLDNRMRLSPDLF